MNDGRPPNDIFKHLRRMQLMNEQLDLKKAIGPIYTIELMAEKIRPIIRLQNPLSEALSPIIEFRQQIQDSLKPVIEINQRIKELTRPLSDIDWKAISKAATERVKQIDQKLQEYENFLWCLDVDTYAAMEDEQTGIEELPLVVEKGLEEYIETITDNSMFSLHESLIEETYEAYKAGYYRLCVFPLFAVFEHIINSWFDGNIQKESILVTKKPQGRKYYNKIKALVTIDKSDEFKMYVEIFALSVLRLYLKTFKTFGDEPGTELNRHSIAHGFHDYNSVSKNDVLKMFQLLKATSILQYVASEDFIN